MQVFEILLGAEKSGRVFPDVIEDADWVGYHGTASAYSQRIEQGGFRRVKPLPDVDIDLVGGLAARCGTDPGEAVAGFKTLNSVSFTPISALALAFAEPGKTGGQGVGYVREQARALLDGHSASLSPEEMSELTRIVDDIDQIRSSRPVIYAVDLRGLELARFQSLTAAIHVYGDIPASRLIARATVPDGIDHSAVDQAALRAKIRAIYQGRGTHWLCQLQR